VETAVAKNVFYKVIDLVDKWSKAFMIMDRCMGMYPSKRVGDGSGQGAQGNDIYVSGLSTNNAPKNWPMVVEAFTMLNDIRECEVKSALNHLPFCCI